MELDPLTSPARPGSPTSLRLPSPLTFPARSGSPIRFHLPAFFHFNPFHIPTVLPLLSHLPPKQPNDWRQALGRSGAKAQSPARRVGAALPPAPGRGLARPERPYP